MQESFLRQFNADKASSYTQWRKAIPVQAVFAQVTKTSNLYILFVYIVPKLCCCLAFFFIVVKFKFSVVPFRKKRKETKHPRTAQCQMWLSVAHENKIDNSKFMDIVDDFMRSEQVQREEENTQMLIVCMHVLYRCRFSQSGNLNRHMRVHGTNGNNMIT